jgi:hypothetical protein
MSKEYAVGKWKPPLHTRFKKGQSGNPSGRPKGKVTVADADAVLDQVLNALIPVNENGRPLKITKMRALYTRTVNEALKGHLPSAKLLFAHLIRRSAQAAPDSSGEQSKTDDEAKKELEAYLNEIRARMSNGASAADVHNKGTDSAAEEPEPDHNRGEARQKGGGSSGPGLPTT